MQGLPLSGRKAELVNRLRKHGDSRWHALTVRELQKLLRERGVLNDTEFVGRFLGRRSKVCDSP